MFDGNNLLSLFLNLLLFYNLKSVFEFYYNEEKRWMDATLGSFVLTVFATLESIVIIFEISCSMDLKFLSSEPCLLSFELFRASCFGFT